MQTLVQGIRLFDTNQCNAMYWIYRFSWYQIINESIEYQPYSKWGIGHFTSVSISKAPFVEHLKRCLITMVKALKKILSHKRFQSLREIVHHIQHTHTERCLRNQQNWSLALLKLINWVRIVCVCFSLWLIRWFYANDKTR